MELKNHQYQGIIRKYEQIQARNRDIHERRYAEVLARTPQYAQLEEAIAVASVQYGKKLIFGEEDALAALKRELAVLRAQKNDLLTSAGFSANYLDPIYSCQDCHDTGYQGMNKCHCFQRAVVQMLYEESNLAKILESENFDNFSLRYYSSNFFDERDKTRSAKDVAKKAYEDAQSFAKQFSQKHSNLLIGGDVGVGKTFLANCIAKEALDRGHSVLYYSAIDLFQLLGAASFERHDAEVQYTRSLIEDVELLIIDDLGTEYTNHVVVSNFFNLINHRLTRKKSTIISTNLSNIILQDRYTARTCSRIFANYKKISLIGDSIRQQKSLMQREEM